MSNQNYHTNIYWNIELLRHLNVWSVFNKLLYILKDHGRSGQILSRPIRLLILNLICWNHIEIAHIRNYPLVSKMNRLSAPLSATKRPQTPFSGPILFRSTYRTNARVLNSVAPPSTVSTPAKPTAWVLINDSSKNKASCYMLNFPYGCPTEKLFMWLATARGLAIGR